MTHTYIAVVASLSLALNVGIGLYIMPYGRRR